MLCFLFSDPIIVVLRKAITPITIIQSAKIFLALVSYGQKQARRACVLLDCRPYLFLSKSGPGVPVFGHCPKQKRCFSFEIEIFKFFSKLIFTHLKMFRHIVYLV